MAFPTMKVTLDVSITQRTIVCRFRLQAARAAPAAEIVAPLASDATAVFRPDEDCQTGKQTNEELERG